MSTRTRARPIEEVRGPEADEPEAAPPDEVATYADLQAVLAADSRPVERVVVIEWPGAPVMYVRGLSGRDRDTIENTTFGEGVHDISAMIVARALCTPDGQPLVPRTAKAMAEAVQMLSARSAGGLLHLQRVARHLSGLDQASVDELEALLSKAQSAASGTG